MVSASLASQLGDGEEDVELLPFDGRSQEDIAAFLQSWLYFGFLGEVTDIIDIPLNVEDFISEDFGPVITGAGAVTNDEFTLRWITSHRLREYIEMWRYEEAFRSELEGPEYEYLKVERHARFKSLVKAIRHWILVLSGLVEVEERSSADILGAPRLSKRGVLSPELTTIIPALDQALYNAAVRIWSLEKEDDLLNYVPDSEYLLSVMLDHGWCPHDVHMLRDHATLDLEYYLSSYRPLRSERDHKSCSELQCTAENIVDEASYVVKHVTEGCDCSFAGPNVNDLISSLQSGGIPVISLHEVTRRRRRSVKHPRSFVGLANWQPDALIDYVAISHVWTDGLGNPNDNCLPLCQLSRLGQMAIAVQALDTHVSLSGPVLLWIDTLCVPVGKLNVEYRKMAICKMADTYKKARKVLVLDSEISRGSQKASSLEKSTRIFASSWQRRLWTLQEGISAMDLCFQFRNGPVSSTSILEDSLLDEGLDEHFHTSIYASLRSLSQIGPMLAFSQTENSPHERLWAIWRCLQFRTTSKAEDETVCIANMMGIDSGPLLQTMPDKRMEVLLRSIGSFPAGIILLSDERLSTEGFRWGSKIHPRQAERSPALDGLARFRLRLKPVQSSGQEDLHQMYEIARVEEDDKLLNRKLQGKIIEYAIVAEIYSKYGLMGALVAVRGGGSGSQCLAVDFIQKVFITDEKTTDEDRRGDTSSRVQQQNRDREHLPVLEGQALSARQKWHIF